MRLMRALGRGEARNLDAMMTSIADRTCIDFMRSRGRWSAILGPINEVVLDTTEAADTTSETLGDPRDRVRFVVLQFFEQQGSACHELARAYFAELDWSLVAQGLGRSAEAVRKQWSRCLGILRREAAKSPQFQILADGF